MRFMASVLNDNIRLQHSSADAPPNCRVDVFPSIVCVYALFCTFTLATFQSISLPPGGSNCSAGAQGSLITGSINLIYSISKKKK